MTAAHGLAGWEERARSTMDPAAFAYVESGAGDEVSLRENRAAFSRLRLVPRVLTGNAACPTATTVLGEEIAAPVMVAPMAYQACVHPDGDLNVAAAAAAAGIGMCLSSLSNHSAESVALAGAGGLLWYQLYPYRDAAMTAEVVAAARVQGYKALVITVDTPTYGIRDRERASGFSVPAHLPLPGVPAPAGTAITPAEVSALMKPDLGWTDIERFVATSGLPVVVKGLLHPDDAARAVDAGARGVVVSNHGGRQLDTAMATIDALPEIVDRVSGGCEVYLDSGVRRGTDVLKALALGARAVFVGRPVAWANGAAGRDGVAEVLRQIIEETQNAMILTGCESVDAVGPDVVRAAAPIRDPGWRGSAA
jgi:4-hydroxymandelate oxidase